MYRGVVEIDKASLPSLIKTAENLQIKGLAFPDHLKREDPTPCASSEGSFEYYQVAPEENRAHPPDGDLSSGENLQDSRLEWQGMVLRDTISPPSKRKRLQLYASQNKQGQSPLQPSSSPSPVKVPSSMLHHNQIFVPSTTSTSPLPSVSSDAGPHNIGPPVAFTAPPPSSGPPLKLVTSTNQVPHAEAPAPHSSCNKVELISQLVPPAEGPEVEIKQEVEDSSEPGCDGRGQPQPPPPPSGKDSNELKEEPLPDSGQESSSIPGVVSN